MRYKSLFLLFAVFLIGGLIYGIIHSVNQVNQNEETPKAKLRILTAGSLMVPLSEVEKAFEGEHPEVDVEIEGHGSIQVIRHIIDLGEKADVIFVADYSLIPDLMFNRKMPNSTLPYADWYAKFSTNEMVIAFTNKSKYANEISSDNWYEILARKDVKFGFSDPVLDACGYRTLMLIQLAEGYYNNRTIFETLISKNFNPTFFVESDEGDSNYTIYVPQKVNPKTDKVVIRRSSILLTPLIETNSIDYGFIYLSVAKQHGLNYIKLPPEINLGSEGQTDNYKKVRVEFQFHRFEYIPAVKTRIGLPIEYALTIPNNTPHKKVAIEFVEFLLSKKGRELFYKNYQKIYEKPEMFGNTTEITEMRLKVG